MRSRRSLTSQAQRIVSRALLFHGVVEVLYPPTRPVPLIDTIVISDYQPTATPMPTLSPPRPAATEEIYSSVGLLRTLWCNPISKNLFQGMLGTHRLRRQ
jgi:hypothetical protein